MSNLTPELDTPADVVPRRRISLPPGTIVGYVAGRPVYTIAGGAEDDDEIEVDDDEGDEDDGDEGTDDEDNEEEDERPKPKPPAKKSVAPAKPAPQADDEEWTPPSRGEWERVRRTMAKRKDEKLAVQRQLNELRDKYREQETESERAVREAEEKAEAKYKPIAVKKAMRAGLIEAGATAAIDPKDKDKVNARIARLMKLVDMDDLSVDDDGEVLGVEEQVDSLRADYPELFESPARKKPRPTGAPRQAAPDKPKSAAERHAARALGTA
ncbi:hypothetical protein [Streptomyces sp. NPDC096153]|uniref:phage scaffolding protein n=1 Tax=Streptomyces sp. NPDC096153 TaxID=3155548 RepID=UPI003319E700